MFPRQMTRRTQTARRLLSRLSRRAIPLAKSGRGGGAATRGGRSRGLGIDSRLEQDTFTQTGGESLTTEGAAPVRDDSSESEQAVELGLIATPTLEPATLRSLAE